jgi:hypothetical protein
VSEQTYQFTLTIVFWQRIRDCWRWWYRVWLT